MAGNGDKSREENLAGIRLILEEIRDLKREFEEDRKRAAEDRRKYDELFRKSMAEAAEDRKQAAEDRRQAAENWRRLDEFHRKAMAEAAEDRKGIRDALVVIGKVGRRIIETQDKHTGLLIEIRDILKHRNGGGGPAPLLKPKSPSPPSRRR